MMQARFWRQSRESQEPVPRKVVGGTSAEINMAEFVLLVAAMSRFIRELTVLPVFKSSEIDLTEWIALSVIDVKNGISGKALAKALGINAKRVTQVTAALATAGLIKLSKTKEQDVVTATDVGKAKIAEINAHVHPLLSEVLKGKERSIVGTSKVIRLMTRIGQPAVGGGKSSELRHGAGPR